MRQSRVKIINHLGLHARAAAQLVRLASQFGSKIELRRTDKPITADAKSILSILSLAASQGTELEIRIEGPDEDDALREIEQIFANGFGEL